MDLSGSASDNATKETAEQYHESLKSFDGDMDTDSLKTEIKKIKGAKTGDIVMHIISPENNDKIIPCIYYIHGSVHTLTDREFIYTDLRDLIIKIGFIVIWIEYRGIDSNPFPAALNDCMIGLRWIHSKRDERKISKILLCGDLIGGNLVLSMNIRAKKEGILDHIDGTYALSPMISNLYRKTVIDKDFRQCPSLFLNRRHYFYSKDALTAFADLYSKDHQKFGTNPSVWPYYATDKLVEGLPPHVISVNLSDPLRDESVSYHKLLDRNDVSSRCLLFAHDETLETFLPKVFQTLLSDIFYLHWEGEQQTRVEADWKLERRRSISRGNSNSRSSNSRDLSKNRNRSKTFRFSRSNRRTSQEFNSLYFPEGDSYVKIDHVIAREDKSRIEEAPILQKKRSLSQKLFGAFYSHKDP